MQNSGKMPFRLRLKDDRVKRIPDLSLVLSIITYAAQVF